MGTEYIRIIFEFYGIRMLNYSILLGSAFQYVGCLERKIAEIHEQHPREQSWIKIQHIQIK